MTTLQLSTDAPRCLWCACKLPGESRHVHFTLAGKAYDTVVCSPEHEQAIVEAYRYIQRFLPVFWIGMTLTVALFLASNFVRATTWCVLAAFFSLGLTLLLCPFTTPQTVDLLGLRRSFLIGRIAGVVVVVVVLGLSISLWFQLIMK